jgi:electron transport complex protein RnfC
MSRASTLGKGTFAGGVHPPEHKELSADAAIESLPCPAEVKIPFLQHIGAPAVPSVKRGDTVETGQVVATADAFICATIHSSVRGKVGMIGPVSLPNGRRVEALPVKADPEQPLSGQELYDDVLGGDWPTDAVDDFAPEQITEAVKAAGIVGLGGAAFPTFVKLLKNDEKPIDTILVNGCECEPYLTADYRLMVEAPRAAVCGALLAARATDAKQVIVAIEDNKPRAIEAMEQAAAGTGVDIAVVRTKYPQGGEKQTVQAALDREIPGGGLPLDVGVVVINVGTTASIARAVLRDKPLTHRVVTVTGEGITTPKNLLAPVGAPVQALLDFCGGLNEKATRIISGGPMMGFSIGDLTTPVTKGTSGITVLTENETAPLPQTNCIRCGKCVDACPLGLLPTRLALACRAQDWDLAKRHHVLTCCECGSCAFECPAGLPIVQLIRTGKSQMPK